MQFLVSIVIEEVVRIREDSVNFWITKIYNTGMDKNLIYKYIYTFKGRRIF